MGTATQHWVRRGLAAGLLLLTAALLSACIEASSSSTIASDFTGTTNIRIGISKVAIQTLTALGNSLGGTPTPNSSGSSDNIFGDLTTQVTAMGGTATPYENDNFIGVDITLPFNSLDEMQNQINSILGNSSGAPSASNPLSGSGGSQNALIQITATSTDSGLRIDGTVDPLSTLTDPSSATAVPGLDLSALLTGGGLVQLSFTMPGSITNADALATQNGNTVSWSFKVGDKAATIFAEANKS
ncbi:MAG: LppM family (lipo)protein [Thermomicrobiales bacterium]